MPPATRIMVSKPVDKRIPDWREPRNQQGFAKRNPDIVDNQEAALENP
jgi:hypothetical protein